MKKTKICVSKQIAILVAAGLLLVLFVVGITSLKSIQTSRSARANTNDKDYCQLITDPKFCIDYTSYGSKLNCAWYKCSSTCHQRGTPNEVACPNIYTNTNKDTGLAFLNTFIDTYDPANDALFAQWGYRYSTFGGSLVIIIDCNNDFIIKNLGPTCDINKRDISTDASRSWGISLLPIRVVEGSLLDVLTKGQDRNLDLPLPLGSTIYRKDDIFGIHIPIFTGDPNAGIVTAALNRLFLRK